ncbi:unnamed protein product [Porites lobata]|uniref:Uncharacterized protein n=1 Tax=Porites lobata TaxID=104759 RepID=A0ABN8MVF3_9CNID|nr:unnamed protein product [Porites lobata]
MASVKFIVVACLVAILGYFIHRELQMETFAFTLTKHIPAKRSDVYRKFFDEPEFWLKVHPNCVGITNIIRSQDKDGRKTVQFNLHEEVPGPFFGYPSKVHAEVPMTVKEMQENEATHMSTTQFHGWLQFDQEFRFSDAKEGGMMLEERCQYTSAKTAIRYIAPIALAQHKDIMENTRKYFMEVETKNS